MRKILVLCLLLPVLAGCRSAGPQVSEFEGFYFSMFEVSAFEPCGQEGKEVYWLKAGGAPDFWPSYEALGGTGTRVYVRFVGELSPPSLNGYGHLNQYKREVKVTQLLEMSLEGVCSK